MIESTRNTYTARIAAGALTILTIVGGTGIGVAGAARAELDCPDAPAGMNVIISDAAEIEGTNGDDFICAGPSHNVINARGGNDIVFAGAGNDVIWGRAGHDQIHGGTGDDSLRGGPGRDELFGESGSDVVRGGQGADKIFGDEGRDRVNGGSGGDMIVGGTGSDTLRGRSGSDEIHGGEGSDKLVGGAGNDALYGGSENDRIAGGEGDDYIDAGDGDDHVKGGADNDSCLHAEAHDGCEEGLEEETHNSPGGNSNNTAPVLSVDPNGYSVDENSVAGAAVAGDAPLATDADGDSITFAIGGGSGAPFFGIDAETGIITVAFNEAGLDHETVDQLTVEIIASDGELTDSEMVTVLVADVNEAPVFSPEMDDFSIAENSPAGTVADGGPVAATDVDGDTVFYSLTDGFAMSLFDIDELTGQVTVKQGEAPLDFETTNSYVVEVTASDGELSTTLDMTITVDDVNEAPVLFLESEDFWLDAHADNGQPVEFGEMYAIEVDAGDSVTWAIVSGNEQGIFGIDSETGALYLADNKEVDHHTYYSLTVSIVDQGGLSDSTSITVDTHHD